MRRAGGDEGEESGDTDATGADASTRRDRDGTRQRQQRPQHPREKNTNDSNEQARRHTRRGAETGREGRRSSRPKEPPDRPTRMMTAAQTTDAVVAAGGEKRSVGGTSGVACAWVWVEAWAVVGAIAVALVLTALLLLIATTNGVSGEGFTHRCHHPSVQGGVLRGGVVGNAGVCRTRDTHTRAESRRTKSRSVYACIEHAGHARRAPAAGWAFPTLSPTTSPTTSNIASPDVGDTSSAWSPRSSTYDGGPGKTIRDAGEVASGTHLRGGNKDAERVTSGTHSASGGVSGKFAWSSEIEIAC